MIEINNHFEKPVDVSQIIYDKIDSVEREGIVPLRSQIRMYKEAGVLLKATRALQYDSGSDLDDFEKVDTAFRDARDYADFTELINRAQATSKVVDILSSKTEKDSNLTPSRASDKVLEVTNENRKD